MKVSSVFIIASMVCSVAAQKAASRGMTLSMKCGNVLYTCGATPATHACVVPSIKTKETLMANSDACKALASAIKPKNGGKATVFSANSRICPNGNTVSFYARNIVGKGELCSPSRCTKCHSAKCGGDPHFMTYDGTAYTYHGQCDLVMANAKDIDGTGLPFDVHARTTIKNDWSYVSNVAVKIGNDVLEITTDANVTHYFNNEPNVDFPILMADKFIVRTQRVEAFPGLYRTDYMIDLKERDDGARERGDTVHIKYFKEMLTVNVDAKLEDTMGMLGVTGEEGMIKRDLVTVLAKEDTATMGLEWQVRDNEPKLFNDMNRAPQYPEQCILPKTESRRRLRSEMGQMAAKACADVEASMKEFCIHDVVLTGDVQSAYMYLI